MRWYKIAETTAEKASFLLVDFSYYPAFLEIKKKTKELTSFSSYINRKENLVSEFMREDERKKKSLLGYNFFLNNKKLTAYKTSIQKIIKKIAIYKDEVDKITFDNISLNRIINLLKKGSTLYHKALSLFLISQPEYTSKIEESIKKELRRLVTEKNAEKVFIVLSLPLQHSCLENERYEWLKNIIIPGTGRFRNFKEASTDWIMLKKIEMHIKKYKYYPAGPEFGLWDKKHYLRLLKSDFSTDRKILDEELLNLGDKKKINKNKKQKIIKKFKVNINLLRKIDIATELGLLRINLRVLGWQFFNYLLPKIIDICSKRLGIPKKELNALTYLDFVRLLKGNLKYNTALKLELKGKMDENILISITPGRGYQVFFGQLADKRFNSEINQKEIKKVEKFKGVVANSKGILEGKVFLLKWGVKDFKKRIYKFPQNHILVAGQTKPCLMPAIRKAKAIITDEGGLLCHAAIVSRELNIPCLIGTKIATKVLRDGDLVEIDTIKGIVKILEKAR